MNEKTTVEFTPKQLKDFAVYKRVQMGGRFNMFDPRARGMTTLTLDEWLFVIQNYNALSEASKK